MPQGEGIGIHDHYPASAFFGKTLQIGAVALQSPAVLHQDSLGSAGQNMESQALENGLILRLGKELKFQDTPGRCKGNQMRDQRSHQTLLPGLRSYSNTFNNVTGKTGASQNVAIFVLDGAIYI